MHLLIVADLQCLLDFPLYYTLAQGERKRLRVRCLVCTALIDYRDNWEVQSHLFRTFLSSPLQTFGGNKT